MRYDGKLTYKDISKCHIEIHRSDDGEWAGLYIDGKLDTYGDAYLADERLQTLFGVVLVGDSPWLKDGIRTPYDTTAEIEAAREERDARLATAADLREQAAALEARAKELEAS